MSDVVTEPGRAPARWLRRDEPVAPTNPATATGLLRVGAAAESCVGFGREDRVAALRLTAETLVAAGVRPDDRVVVALNSDGDLGGTLLAEAASEVAAAAAAPGPRGRMRLLRLVESTRANVLVATPTGAADFLARLHLEFLVDPLDLGLRLLLLTGEIADAATYRYLAAEFGADVVELYTDPLTTVPLAHRRPASTEVLTPTRPGLLHLLDTDLPGYAEIGVTNPWHSRLDGIGVRTGQLTVAGEAVTAPRHTRGDRLLVRGRWLSLATLGKALRGIDGISGWELRVSRDGTLDAAVLTITFSRASLVGNGMWRARIEQALDAVTPVAINVVIAEEVREDAVPPEVVDERGHHLATPS